MPKKINMYEDVLNKMEAGIDEYVDYYYTKLNRMNKFWELKNNYETLKKGYDAAVVIKYDGESLDFHKKNVSKLEAEMTVLKSQFYPMPVQKKNPLKNFFNKLFYVSYSKRNNLISDRLFDLEMRMEKSKEAYDFYKNKYDTSVSYLNGLGMAFADKNVNDIKMDYEIAKTELDDFILVEGKNFEDFSTQEDFYKVDSKYMSTEIVKNQKKIDYFWALKEEFNERRNTIQTVAEAKKLLNDINAKITSC